MISRSQDDIKVTVGHTVYQNWILMWYKKKTKNDLLTKTALTLDGGSK